MLFDGGSLENSGQGAAAAVLLMPNGKRYTVSQLISFVSKHEAEYTALIIGLKKAQKLGLRSLEIKGDSDLIFNQVHGLTKVKDERLLKLYRMALELFQSFEQISLEWISPEQNRPVKSAIKRCIEEALRRDKPKTQTVSKSVSSAIATLIQKGEQVTDEDYHQLTVEPDEWTDKPLSELRSLISLEIRDTIALQWQGDENHLAEMYRWYLRGLPAKMACYKVNLEQMSNGGESEKLPWEEALSLPPDLSSPSEELSDPFISLLSEFNEVGENLVKSLMVAKNDPEMAHLFEGNILFDLDVNEKSLLDNSEESQQDNESQTFILPPNPQINQTKLLEEPFSELTQDNLSDKQQDTLPSELGVTEIVKMISLLSFEGKMVLAKELVKFPDMVKLILKSIADNVSRGRSSL
ncbi:ribonuclease H [Aphanothece sacrum FPU1]|uniref:Ribonuclease H n=2 Tax=Aphanothece sacrum TaxID=1122 RepID=A0A401IMT3_APHSA|nr:ribonuclease H [Aphanothece sacrum FPU1]GBF84708.1 ribonuclease H [Aphanothece sacrum FPU3]